MRRGLLSLAATVLAIPVLLGVVRNSYTLEVAAVRMVVLALAVVVIDRLVAPALSVLLAVMRRPSVPEEDGARPA